MPPGDGATGSSSRSNTSLDVLEPHRVALRALIPVLVGDPDDGVFAASTAFSRLRVQRVFEEAVAGASDAPKQPLAEALGRLLYLIHLAVLLWWLLDKTPKQRATAALVSLTQQLLPSVGARASPAADPALRGLRRRTDPRRRCSAVPSPPEGLMFLLRRPSPAAIDRFLRESQDLPLSYGPIGLVRAETSASSALRRADRRHWPRRRRFRAGASRAHRVEAVRHRMGRTSFHGRHRSRSEPSWPSSSVISASGR